MAIKNLLNARVSVPGRTLSMESLGGESITKGLLHVAGAVEQFQEKKKKTDDAAELFDYDDFYDQTIMDHELRTAGMPHDGKVSDWEETNAVLEKRRGQIESADARLEADRQYGKKSRAYGHSVRLAAAVGKHEDTKARMFDKYESALMSGDESEVDRYLSYFKGVVPDSQVAQFTDGVLYNKEAAEMLSEGVHNYSAYTTMDSVSHWSHVSQPERQRFVVTNDQKQREFMGDQAVSEYMKQVTSSLNHLNDPNPNYADVIKANNARVDSLSELSPAEKIDYKLAFESSVTESELSFAQYDTETYPTRDEFIAEFSSRNVDSRILTRAIETYDRAAAGALSKTASQSLDDEFVGDLAAVLSAVKNLGTTVFRGDGTGGDPENYVAAINLTRKVYEKWRGHLASGGTRDQAITFLREYNKVLASANTMHPGDAALFAIRSNKFNAGDAAVLINAAIEQDGLLDLVGTKENRPTRIDLEFIKRLNWMKQADSMSKPFLDDVFRNLDGLASSDQIPLMQRYVRILIKEGNDPSQSASFMANLTEDQFNLLVAVQGLNVSQLANALRSESMGTMGVQIRQQRTASFNSLTPIRVGDRTKTREFAKRLDQMSSWSEEELVSGILMEQIEVQARLFYSMGTDDNVRDSWKRAAQTLYLRNHGTDGKSWGGQYHEYAGSYGSPTFRGGGGSVASIFSFMNVLFDNTMPLYGAVTGNADNASARAQFPELVSAMDFYYSKEQSLYAGYKEHLAAKHLRNTTLLGVPQAMLPSDLPTILEFRKILASSKGRFSTIDAVGPQGVKIQRSGMSSVKSYRVKAVGTEFMAFMETRDRTDLTYLHRAGESVRDLTHLGPGGFSGGRAIYSLNFASENVTGSLTRESLDYGFFSFGLKDFLNSPDPDRVP